MANKDKANKPGTELEGMGRAAETRTGSKK